MGRKQQQERSILYFIYNKARHSVKSLNAKLARQTIMNSLGFLEMFKGTFLASSHKTLGQ